MSAISSMLSAVEPWSCTTQPEPDRCATFSHSSFGLNDPQSQTTASSCHIVPDSNQETANFSNPRARIIHCLKYGDFVRSIPKPHDQPSHCDFILYADDKSFLCLVETKVTTKRGTKVRQLSSTLQSLMHVQGVRTFSELFRSRRCCFFRKTPPSPAPGLKATVVFNRLAGMLRGDGKRINCQQQSADVSEHRFELWHFSDNDVCQLN